MNANNALKAFAVTGPVFAAASGLVLGYWYAKKRLEAKYAEIAQEEIAEAKVYFSQLNKTGKFSTPAEAVEALQRRVPGASIDTELLEEEEPQEVPVATLERVLDGLRYHTKSEKPTVVVNNVFREAVKANADEEEDYSAEIAARTPNEPYIISKEEYFGDENGYSQIVLTYYAGDHTLVDEDEDIVDNVVFLIGQDNLRFGHRSGDQRVVYVRNNVLQTEYEVIRHDTKYSEVAGLT